MGFINVYGENLSGERPALMQIRCCTGISWADVSVPRVVVMMCTKPCRYHMGLRLRMRQVRISACFPRIAPPPHAAVAPIFFTCRPRQRALSCAAREVVEHRLSQTELHANA